MCPCFYLVGENLVQNVTESVGSRTGTLQVAAVRAKLGTSPWRVRRARSLNVGVLPAFWLAATSNPARG
jgi:hypothetical protein